MQQTISYRDRDGFVVVDKMSVHRFVSHAYARTYDHLMGSGLYRQLVDEGLLIRHAEKTLSADEEGNYYRILVPEMIRTISRPSEWSAGQWKDAVLVLLRINALAIGHGMILKDATPFNFTYHKGNCVLFDTLSFDFYEEGQPWIAYRQFCESMLGPLALICYNDAVFAKYVAVSIEGFRLPYISRNLPWRTWFHVSTLFHIHLHAKYGSSGRAGLQVRRSMNTQKLVTLWNMLHRSVLKWQPVRRLQNWTTYYDRDIESENYINDKTRMVTGWLQSIKAGYVVDLGANNGRFALIAARTALEVVAVESDHDCVNGLYRQIKTEKISNITTILADIRQPTPGSGWNNEEKKPLLSRLKGDMLLALALIHHLCITGNVPILFVAELFANLTTGYAIVEFVPKSDVKVREMLRNRKDVFGDYTEENFVRCFSNYFLLCEVHECGSSGRKLFLWSRK
ncbi:MAG: nodulation protein NoeA [Sediminibacterium sp.]